LDFKIVRDEETYVILGKDNLTIHILHAGDIGEMEFYLEVDDLESVWQKIKDKLEGIKVKPPFCSRIRYEGNSYCGAGNKNIIVDWPNHLNIC
jgi:hypothetical protein